MPVYVDTHEGIDLPPGERARIADRVRTSERDEFGVIERGIIIDREADRMHCVLEAPDVDAIERHHAALDVPVERSTIHVADVILKE